jgi:hypothetical protein
MLRPLVNHHLIIGIPKPDNYFDYVHQRLLVFAMPADKWKQHIRECARVCASGGWIEIVETTGQIFEGVPAGQEFSTYMIEGLKTRGIDAYMVEKLDELMREVGLINVTKRTFIGPFGLWGGKAGELFAENYKLASSSARPLITNALGVSKEEHERKCALMLEEFKTYRSYIVIHVYLGQKQ